MKPERIQFAPLISLPAWGIYRAFWFASYRKAETFSDLVMDMAENHGREVSTSVDSVDNVLTIEVPAEITGETEGALAFVEKVAGIYGDYSSPPEVS